MFWKKEIESNGSDVTVIFINGCSQTYKDIKYITTTDGILSLYRNKAQLVAVINNGHWCRLERI